MGKWKTLAQAAIERTAIVAKFICLYHITDTYLFSPTIVRFISFSVCQCVNGGVEIDRWILQVSGPSMLPTLNMTGDVILAEYVSHRLGKVGPGDVVLVRSPENPRKTISKRIVGMEGDTVTYLVDPNFSLRSRTILVPKGHVWIQGDNMYASKDSRHYGPIPYGLILGKVFCRDYMSAMLGLKSYDV
ncbi:hypothetical protein RJ639_013091 [Escallonia herrerae]|uniref:Peptidase S26 domain-containing protein n=1 Tax=Escallonia herrerae TaxID=1293975 RepID=A0AA88VIE3_9ASTE|nr:hypothetical protein RJ639_013091 [Escallonia herrerae]